MCGEVHYRLLWYDNDPATIVHFSEWSSLENAGRFFKSPELIELKRNAGVRSPSIIFPYEIERGVL